MALLLPVHLGIGPVEDLLGGEGRGGGVAGISVLPQLLLQGVFQYPVNAYRHLAAQVAPRLPPVNCR